MKVELEIGNLHAERDSAIAAAYAAVAAHAAYLASTPGSAGIAKCDAHGFVAESCKKNKISLDIRSSGCVYMRIDASRGSLVSHNVVGEVIRALGGLRYLSEIAEVTLWSEYHTQGPAARPWYDVPQSARDWIDSMGSDFAEPWVAGGA